MLFTANKKKTQYCRYAEKRSEKSALIKDCFFAALSGGIICALSQGLKNIYIALGSSDKLAGTYVSLTLVFLSTLLTGIGIYDRIAKHTGAGTLVPITGFANAVCSSAVDTKTEGWIMGVGAKIFTVAGPVILYGSACSVIYGIILFIIRILR